jgi:hypothetical protein
MNGVLENIKRGVSAKEILAVIVVTSLIWLYAEAESVATTSVETFVRVSAPVGADRVVSPADPKWTGAISIRLQGARGSIDAAKTALARGVDLALGAGGIPARPGQHIINLQSAIQNAALRDHTGVVVEAVEPATLIVDVESIVVIADIPIRFSLPEGLLIAGDPVIEPATATVTAPQSVVDRAQETNTPLIATIRFSPSELADLPAGVSRTLTGALELPDGLLSSSSVSISPQSVTVTVRIQSQLSELVLPSVPIWEMIPPPEADNWSITIDPPFLTDLRLSGPTDLVRRVESGEIRVIGVVELSSEILESGGGELGIEFHGLPAGLQVTTDSPRVTVVSVRRTPQAEPQQP